MDTSMFPKAQENQVQHIIELPSLKNEKGYKVEVFLAKEMEVDCNFHSLQGVLLEKDLAGWGYNYYVFQTNGQVMSTMMACPDNVLTKKDVCSESKLLSYNSKLPIIIYTPKGYKAKYRIWNASPDVHPATQVTKDALNKTQKDGLGGNDSILLQFDSKQQLNMKKTNATITVYGFDTSLADVPATVIAQKKISFSDIPFTVKINLPPNPENLIVPKISDKTNAKYYLSFDCDVNKNGAQDAKDIYLDYDVKKSDLDIASPQMQTFYIKQ